MDEMRQRSLLIDRAVAAMLEQFEHGLPIDPEAWRHDASAIVAAILGPDTSDSTHPLAGMTTEPTDRHQDLDDAARIKVVGLGEAIEDQVADIEPVDWLRLATWADQIALVARGRLVERS